MTDRTPPQPDGMNSALRNNIETLSSRAREEAANSPLSVRVAERITAFAGSMTFVLVHLVLFGSWIVLNVAHVPGIRPFDPSLVTLAMAASVEAIFLSTFVLISQNRMALAAQRSADLDLHVGLLAEHELTRLARLVERIAVRLDVSTDDLELEQIEQDVEPAKVMDALDERRPGAGPNGTSAPISRQ